MNRLLNGETLLEQVVNDTQQDHMAMGAKALDSILGGEDDNTKMSRLGKAILDAMIYSPGSDLITAHNTLWGAVNGVTYHIDHERGRTQDTRLMAAWYGDGDRLKRDAVKVACEIAGIDIPTSQGVYA